MNLQEKIKAFAKIKAGDKVLDAAKHKPEATVIDTGKVSQLMRYDSSGAAREAMANGDMKANDNAVAIKFNDDGETSVYAYDDIDVFFYAIEGVEDTNGEVYLVIEKSDNKEKDMKDLKKTNTAETEEEIAVTEAVKKAKKEAEEKAPKKDDEEDPDKKDMEEAKKSKSKSEEEDPDKKDDEEDPDKKDDEDMEESKKSKSEEEDPDKKDDEEESDKKDDEEDSDKKDMEEAAIAKVKAAADTHLNSVKISESGESIDELVASDDSLSEEFKSKAATIFEAAVSARMIDEVATLREEVQLIIADKIEEEINRIAKKLDGYLTYALEQYAETHSDSIEAQLKTEVAESFMTQLKTVFEDHYAEIPEGKLDMYNDLLNQTAAVNTKLEEAQTALIEATTELKQAKRNAVIAEASDGLCQTEIERLTKLTSKFDFEDETSFAEQVGIIKETYFNNGQSEITEDADKAPSKEVTIRSTIVEEETPDDSDENSVMGRYVKAISRHSKTA